MSKTQTLINKAAMIAELIDKTDTDERGILFREIAVLLKGRSQYYTATLIMQMAHEYGHPINSEPDTPNVKVRG